MKKSLLLILLIISSLICSAQLQVKEDSFKNVESFVNINTEKMFDDNDKPYAVLKIKTENINDQQRRELSFGGDAQTFFETEYKDGEVWLYISYYATFIKISHPDLSSTEFWFPFDMEPKKGYELTLVNKPSVDEDFVNRFEKLENALQGTIDSLNFGYIIIKTTPVEGATVFIDGKEMEMKTPFISDKLSHGIHRIQVVKNMYKTYVDVVSLDSSKEIINVELKSNKAEITISSADKAEIWIDDEKKGIGEWNGYVSVDSHTIEARKNGYRTKVQIVTFEANEKKTVKFEPLAQIFGSLDIDTKPRKTHYTLRLVGDDENKITGRTPIKKDKLPIGEYTISFSKWKYLPTTKNITINDGENTKLKVELTQKQYPRSIREKGWVFKAEAGLGKLTSAHAFVYHDLYSPRQEEHTIQPYSHYTSSYKINNCYDTPITYNLLANFGYQINPYVYFGIGTGLMSIAADYFSIPFYVNPKFYFNNRKVSVYLGIKAGGFITLVSSKDYKIDTYNDYYTPAYYNGSSFVASDDYNNYFDVSVKTKCKALLAIEIGFEYKHSSFSVSVGQYVMKMEATITNHYYQDFEYSSSTNVYTPKEYNSTTHNYEDNNSSAFIMLNYGYSIYNIFKLLKK